MGLFASLFTPFSADRRIMMVSQCLQDDPCYSPNARVGLLQSPPPVPVNMCYRNCHLDKVLFRRATA